MDDQRTGDWMLTASGRQFWPLDPRPSEILIGDIAASLAKQCRYAGHTSTHYSVAEHSVLVSQVVPHEHALQALLHDATEAYCVDVPRPVKRALGAVYAEIEDRIWRAIAERFHVSVEMHPCVKAADDAVLLAERAALMPEGGPAWSVPGTAANVTIEALEWQSAQYLFLRRFRELAHHIQ